MLFVWALVLIVVALVFVAFARFAFRQKEAEREQMRCFR